MQGIKEKIQELILKYNDFIKISLSIYDKNYYNLLKSDGTLLLDEWYDSIEKNGRPFGRPTYLLYQICVMFVKRMLNLTLFSSLFTKTGVYF